MKLINQLFNTKIYRLNFYTFSMRRGQTTSKKIQNNYYNKSSVYDYDKQERSFNTYSSHQQRTNQHQNQVQKMVLDQHYSNNILMTVFSTLESLEGAARNVKVRKEEKNFGYYDRVNYDHKSYDELKCQLQTQLRVFKSSKQVFNQENPKGKYEHPESFNRQRIGQEISRYKQVFYNVDGEVYKMCEDLEKILGDNFHSKLFFQTKNFSIKYSQKESNFNKQDILNRGIGASHLMDSEQLLIRQLKVKDPRNLPIYLRKDPYHLKNNKYK